DEGHPPLVSCHLSSRETERGRRWPAPPRWGSRGRNGSASVRAPQEELGDPLEIIGRIERDLHPARVAAPVPDLHRRSQRPLQLAFQMANVGASGRLFRLLPLRLRIPPPPYLLLHCPHRHPLARRKPGEAGDLAVVL